MIEQVEQLLKQLIGLDAESIGRRVIERVVQQRISVLGLADTPYWQHLSGSASEQQALVEAIVVPETWFFRYPESFAALARLAVQRHAALGGSRPLRLLSLPCSSGEEAYSIVMSLLDAGLAPAAFRVDALDISAASLELARTGHYGRNSFRGQELGFRQRYFTPTDSGFQLQARVREQVRLRGGNVLDTALLAGEAPFDFVFCRNLLIYFDRPTQSAVLASLQRLLREDRLFFVGPAEASLLALQGLQPLGEALTFAFQHPAATPKAPAKPVAKPALPRPAPAPLSTRPVKAAVPRVAAPLPRLPAGGGRADAALAAIVELADAGRIDEAWRACTQYLSEHEPNAEVFYWAGLLSDMAGQADSAQTYYRKALYLEPGHVASLVHLAALLTARGDHEAARRLQQRASRTLDTGAKRDG